MVHAAKRLTVRLLTLSVLLAAVASALADDRTNPNPPAARQQPDTEDADFIRIRGQINKALLIYGDGVSTRGYFPVDNAESATRIDIEAGHHINSTWSVGALVQLEWNPYASDVVNQLTNKVDWGASQLRKGEITVVGSGFGKIWIGQGDMASEDTSEVDLSGTEPAGYASVSDFAGGQFYRLANGTLSTLRVGDTFNDFAGQGRKLRIRYDTPEINGLSLGASVGRKVLPDTSGPTVWDVAAKYSGHFSTYDIAAQIAYSDPGRNVHGLVDGSVSALHHPTGLNVTLAGAVEAAPGSDVYYVYGKLGRQSHFFEFGKTALSVDAYVGRNLNVAGSRSTSLGIQAVQSVDSWQTQFYLGLRSYHYDDDTADYKTGFATIAGALVKF